MGCILLYAVAGSAQPLPELESGTLPKTWAVSGPVCTDSSKEWQVHRYNADLYILRESGCSNYEKPFLYLIFGNDKVLLEDTGAGKTNVAEVVDKIIASWAKLHDRPVPELIVIHSHSHRDHRAGDGLFAGREGVAFIDAKQTSIESATGLKSWPESYGSLELGGRKIDVVAIPGHDPVSLALYDSRTGILFTGDSLYPGRLYVSDYPAFQLSIDRLVAFTATRPVAHILGTHIEQSRTPFRDYKVGTIYQPDEAALELSRGDLLELQASLEKTGSPAQSRALSRFSVVVR
ncbi:MAG: MBL fold metallo-hydrolase [Bryobacteraceae bacterium]|nr:MBL fold metallo-hydrolase [Bryobacteraceae bacterium]